MSPQGSRASTILLGGRKPAAFLREHWQKRPLLVRGALPGFRGILDRRALLRLATRDDVVSRLVIEHPRRRGRGRWERHDGPFGAVDDSMLPSTHWTLLVHRIESLVPRGWDLLRAFSFIPAARIDDLMVSYAAAGGSVGPHLDDYDVFLLQGPGRRRWQIAHDADPTTDPRAAIKVLRRFVPDEEWVLEPGDMLYLPPRVAHLGVALEPCFTYSIGFLAPAHQALVQGFLGHLAEAASAEIDPAALYADPDLQPPRHPLEIGDAMVDAAERLFARIRWDRGAIGDFLGRYLTMLPPGLTLEPPARPLAPGAFARRLRRRGRLSLSLPSRGLVRGRRLYLNGQSQPARPPVLRLFRTLVLERALELPLAPVDDAISGLLHGWYSAGALVLEEVRP